MICAYCQRDIRRPCHTEQDVQQRAASHVEPCERVLKIQRLFGRGERPQAVRK